MPLTASSPGTSRGAHRAAIALLSAALCGPAGALTADDADGWTKEFDEDGMAIYSREAPGARVHEVRMIADVDAPARAVRNVIADHEGAAETMPRVAEARVLAREGSVAWVYERIDVPVLRDRDYTVRVVEEDIEGVPGGYRIRFEGTTEQGPPPRRGVVRVELVRGAWEFLPIDRGSRTRTTYTIVIDPRGVIPAFVANIAARKTLPDVLRSLRRWATSPRYASE